MSTTGISTASSQSRRVLSFGGAYKLMAEQVELAWLVEARPGRRDLYIEIVRIAADVYCRRWDGPVVVDGEQVTYGYLQSIYKNLTADHIDFVIDKLDNYRREIRYKKAFIRTALVNSVFEMQVEASNQYAVDHAIPSEGSL